MPNAQVIGVVGLGGLGHMAVKKLVYESTLGQTGKDAATQVVQFPGIIVETNPKTKAT